MEPVIKSKKFDIQKNGTDVFVTNEYEMFNTISGNRLIDKNHVKKLMNSIYINGWFPESQIVVEPGMAVFDGQHRIEALKLFAEEYGVRPKIKYTVQKSRPKDAQTSIEWVQAFNDLNKKWNALDYAQSFAKRGYEDYIYYLDFKKTHKFNHSTCLILLSNKPDAGNVNKNFIAGKFKILYADMAELRAERVHQLKTLFPYADSVIFVRIMIRFWNQKNFSHSEFIHKLELNRDKLYKTDADGYIRQIQKIYNHANRNKINFNV